MTRKELFVRIMNELGSPPELVESVLKQAEREMPGTAAYLSTEASVRDVAIAITVKNLSPEDAQRVASAFVARSRRSN